MPDAPAAQPTAPTAPVPQQMSLPGAEQLFSAVGLDTLPHGASEMTRKQLLFAVEFLKCGNQSQAARNAGLSPDNASKLLKNTAVLRFINSAAKTVAQNGDHLVRRKWELSVSLHTELMEIRGKAPTARTAADAKREAKLVRMANQTDMLLAALLNRLGIKLTGEVVHTHQTTQSDFIVVPPDALAGFAAARQRAVAAGHASDVAQPAAGGRN